MTYASFTTATGLSNPKGKDYLVAVGARRNSIVQNAEIRPFTEVWITLCAAAIVRRSTLSLTTVRESAPRRRQMTSWDRPIDPDEYSSKAARRPETRGDEIGQPPVRRHRLETILRGPTDDEVGERDAKAGPRYAVRARPSRGDAGQLRAGTGALPSEPRHTAGVRVGAPRFADLNRLGAD
jgi:hypothetical protein